MSEDDPMVLIEDCEHRESKLTEWEAEFIDSIKAQLIAGRRLSTKQEALLEAMWERVTANG